MPPNPGHRGQRNRVQWERARCSSRRNSQRKRRRDVAGQYTIGEKPTLTAASADPAINSPWLRAAMLTPSVTTHMSATRIGAIDMRPLQELIYKPSQSLAMSFSRDPILA